MTLEQIANSPFYQRPIDPTWGRGGPSVGPMRPNLANSPSLLQGMWSQPQYRGKSAEELSAMLPTFETWDQAIAQTAGSDAEKTMRLREAYGLSNLYRVQNGRLVSDNHSTRNGILGGLALIGGMSALGAVGGGTGAAAGASGLSTGAIAPTMTPISGAIAGGTAAGATGAAAGGGMAGQVIGAGINAGFQYAGNRAQAGAANRAAATSDRAAADALAYQRERDAELRAQWEAEQKFRADQWAAQEEERRFARADAERRQRLEDEADRRREPYRQASAAALGRLGDLIGRGQSTWRSPSNVGRS